MMREECEPDFSFWAHDLWLRGLGCKDEGVGLLKTERQKGEGLCAVWFVSSRQRIVFELMTSDRKLKASREGSE